ncbi:hypothetical protein CAPTEDRAFT_223030 [Capitella teleta]|uniref:Calcineurin-like phosphoesterase domain-containing protein n=1 Tax=Capitella teleta TaxID=283909 RepID=R7T942_CAPTE|nr:hypothetical protein CAPTEDRAFT_223030 [Capitella teleta]|eukprot:ELT89953.1 hypothetical protein CAPTEDRAFT_223030 [Capitella teleta]
MASNETSECHIWAVSDLHVEHKDNLRLVEGWSRTKYQKDVLLLAGDVTNDLTLLTRVLKTLKSKFKEVFFVPGNHELWVRPNDKSGDSLAKFYHILAVCDHIGVHYMPKKVKVNSGNGGSLESVWIVPLFSWYATPEDDAQDSLYVKPPYAENADLMHNMWMDNKMCIWPQLPESKSRYFAHMNDPIVKRTYDAPVISFSHVLPRRELIGASEEDIKQVARERARHGCPQLRGNFRSQGGAKNFNFARVAGCYGLDRQIRKIGASVHVYGHQHRNRDRVIDGVRYISHCLGKPAEQKEGWAWGYRSGPKLVWFNK